MVDLEAPYNLTAMLIYNRLDAPHHVTPSARPAVAQRLRLDARTRPHIGRRIRRRMGETRLRSISDPARSTRASSASNSANRASSISTRSRFSAIRWASPLTKVARFEGQRNTVIVHRGAAPYPPARNQSHQGEFHDHRSRLRRRAAVHHPRGAQASRFYPAGAARCGRGLHKAVAAGADRIERPDLALDRGRRRRHAASARRAVPGRVPAPCCRKRARPRAHRARCRPRRSMARPSISPSICMRCRCMCSPA